jgi:phosphoserine phosphatase RsbU/P
MTPRPLPALKLTVRAKILALFLALALASLLVTGYVALVTIGDVGRSAESSSRDLGQQAVVETTAALRASAEEHLVRIASDQATITNILFEDTEAELEVLAVYASTLQQNPPVKPLTGSSGTDEPPADRSAVTVFSIAPGATVSANSTEFTSLAGMDDLLKGTYKADADISSVYVATDSGILRAYPYQNLSQAGFDPRTRTWFAGAKNTTGIYWSDPYVDAAGNGLVVSSAKAVKTPYGAWVIGSDVTVDVINAAFLNGTLGGKGYAVLVDSNGDILSRPGLSAGNLSWDQPFPQENVLKSTDPSLLAVGRNMTAGRTGIEVVHFGGRESYVAYAPVRSQNWSFAVTMPVDEIVSPVLVTSSRIAASTAATEVDITRRTNDILLVFTVLFGIILVIVIALAVYLARVITRPVDALREAALALGCGDLDYRVAISTGDEFEDLAASFNTMAADLKRNIDDLRRTTAEKERYTKELEIAREIQQTFLPESPPVIYGYGIAATTIPAMEIGGDLYDFIPVAGNCWGFVIADVSGKGVSAALYMARCRTLLHASGGAHADPSVAIRRANSLIYEDGRSSMFITVFYGVLDPAGRTFSYVNAGHNPPLLVRGDPPEIRQMEGAGIALGVVQDVDGETTAIPVESGDLIVLYTDGVTEAFDERDEAFGEDRLAASVCRNRSRPVQEIVDLLVADIRQFSGNAPQSDDITLVVIRVP